jgi:hypothetical protein
VSNHTPGPWEWWVVGIDEEMMLLPKRGQKLHEDAVLTLGWVSCGDGSSGKEPSLEDKNLIAAAPELLAALEGMVEPYEGVASVAFASYTREKLEAARAAIAKAKGETP